MPAAVRGVGGVHIGDSGEASRLVQEGVQATVYDADEEGRR